MDYFQLYSLPISFHPPQDAVRKQYYALSKKFHPDFYANAPEEKQQEILMLSTENNRAYQVLSDPSKTLHYVLTLYNMLPEGEQYTLPQEFLMNMMDVNEALIELEFEADAEKLNGILSEVRTIEKTLTGELNELTEGFDRVSEDRRNVKLAEIKDLYFRMKYLARLKERL